MKLHILTAAFAAILGITLAGIPSSAHAADATTTTNAPAAVMPKVKKTEYKGTLTAVDTTANTITVQSGTKALMLAVSATTKIQKDKKPATLADFAVGDKVSGSYTKDATGAMTAASLRKKTMTAVAPKTAASAAAPAAAPVPATAPAAQ